MLSYQPNDQPWNWEWYEATLEYLTAERTIGNPFPSTRFGDLMIFSSNGCIPRCRASCAQCRWRIQCMHFCIWSDGSTSSIRRAPMYVWNVELAWIAVSGISFRCIEKVFNLLNYHTASSNRMPLLEKCRMRIAMVIWHQRVRVEGRFEFSIQVGMLEVYNDNVFDILLKQKKKVASDK